MARSQGGGGQRRAARRTSISFHAALLFRPCTLAWRAKRSLLWRDFHCELDDAFRRVSSGPKRHL